MDKIDLHRVDLVCVDNKYIEDSMLAIARTKKHCDFHNVLFFTQSGIESLNDYCRFIMRNLVDHLTADYALIIQHDGYVLNPGAWTDEFYDWDYIGAPWWYQGDDRNVGNGGFSLRSRKFLEESSRLAITISTMGGNFVPEDEILCRNYAEWMRGRGVRFAPEQLAARFSLERNGKFGNVWNGQFGFHNKETNIDKYYTGDYEMYR